jgi:hypothetical protein
MDDGVAGILYLFPCTRILGMAIIASKGIFERQNKIIMI